MDVIWAWAGALVAVVAMVVSVRYARRTRLDLARMRAMLLAVAPPRARDQASMREELDRAAELEKLWKLPPDEGRPS